MADTSERLWKVNCMENHFPGMWLRWLKHQAVGIGWPPQEGYHLTGSTKKSSGWSTARKALGRMKVGDYLFAYLGQHRVGRLGQIVDIRVADEEWNPLVDSKVHPPHGEMGRQVLVRWDLVNSPDNRDKVVSLPEGYRLKSNEVRRTISEVRSLSIEQLRDVLGDAENWVGIIPRFRYERALANYIAAYPHRLEEGLLPHPYLKLRENPFADRTRADVLLVDKENVPVVVECKQHGPSEAAIDQLRRYMAWVTKEARGDVTKVRGILVHGGARRLSRTLQEYAADGLEVEVVRYSVDVVFSGG